MIKIDQLRYKVNRAVRRQWLKYSLRDVSNNENHAGLDRIYLMPDPWSLDSPREHARFAATNALIAAHFGKPDTILEIGAGEGLQSSYLRRMCRSLNGVEVSPTAVARARQRLPDATFEAGTLQQQSWLNTGRTFDLVVACEVLYYVADLQRTLDDMNRLGDACVVSFFSAEAYKLVDALEQIPGLHKSWFYYEGVTWLMAWWQNRPSIAGQPSAARS